MAWSVSAPDKLRVDRALIVGTYEAHAGVHTVANAFASVLRDKRRKKRSKEHGEERDEDRVNNDGSTHA